MDLITPLFYACIQKNNRVFQEELTVFNLLSRDDLADSTILHTACEEDNCGAAAYILNFMEAHNVCPGTLLNAQDRHGDTPVHVACYTGNTDLLALFRDRYMPLIDLDLKNCDGEDVRGLWRGENVPGGGMG